MKLYTVIRFIDHEGYDVPIAIFTTKEKAEEYLKRKNENKESWEDWDIFEYEADKT
jgi:hypothetical protein